MIAEVMAPLWASVAASRTKLLSSLIASIGKRVR
jgi:hypothetical protein